MKLNHRDGVKRLQDCREKVLKNHQSEVLIYHHLHQRLQVIIPWQGRAAVPVT